MEEEKKTHNEDLTKSEVAIEKTKAEEAKFMKAAVITGRGEFSYSENAVKVPVPNPG